VVSTIAQVEALALRLDSSHFRVAVRAAVHGDSAGATDALSKVPDARIIRQMDTKGTICVVEFYDNDRLEFGEHKEAGWYRYEAIIAETSSGPSLSFWLWTGPFETADDAFEWSARKVA
jgi:hypothetical protein